MTESVATFEQQRPRLFGLAYRMLGSAHDAEDILQDAWLRWAGVDQGSIESPSAWLTTVVTRLCLNRLASARARRESYPGPWLPEPVLTDDGSLGPLDTVQQRETVSFALLIALERLTPAERAVYVLREAFGYGYREIGEVVGLGEAHCRQLQRRAREHLRQRRAGASEPDRDAWLRLVQQFFAAAGAGDLAALEALLAADVSASTDGGGKVTAARRPVHGRERVARYLVGVLRLRPAGALVLTTAEVNAAPAVLGWIDDVLAGVATLDVADGRVLANPDKLAYLTHRMTPPDGVV